ncbi:MAG: hypothetical protein EBX69_00525, partial [Betaproteobacteria bacterium]|nr:hypothetical protein [Betaproteobacteria bacterium]
MDAAAVALTADKADAGFVEPSVRADAVAAGARLKPLVALIGWRGMVGSVLTVAILPILGVGGSQI